jgi:hypothetical protein
VCIYKSRKELRKRRIVICKSSKLFLNGLDLI